MAVYQCKLCGGAVGRESGSAIGTCRSCGTLQTMPLPGDETKVTLFNTANRLRRRREFEEALRQYESIRAAYGADAETYWSLLLCRYGVRYVKDKETGRFIPTVNQKHTAPVLQDKEYLSTLLYAHAEQKPLYEQQAQAIEAAREAGLTDADYEIVEEDDEARKRQTPALHLETATRCIEEQKWQQADENCDKALVLDNKSSEAYLLKLFAELHIGDIEQLSAQNEPFENSDNLRNALWFADEALADRLKLQIIKKNERLEKQYHSATALMQEAYTQYAYQKAAALLEELGDYRDAPQLARKCREKEEQYYKDDVYYAAKAKMQGGSSHDYRAAAGELTKIPGWKDADALLRECREKGEMMEKRVLQAASEKAKIAQQKEEAMLKKAAKRRKIILAITIPLLCLAIVFTIFFRVRILPERRYQAAVAAREAGDIVTAYESFLSMGDYKDSLEKAKALYEQYKPAKLKAANVGDTVYFGTYEQDNDTKNGKEDIAWIVLAKENHRILLISKYGLEAASFHNRQEAVTWDNCSLRKWLNSKFIDTAFTAKEQQQLAPTLVLAQENPKYEIKPGKDTRDRVFLLSINEAQQYFKTDAQRKCSPTTYAYKKGVTIANENNTSLCWWWLRTPGGEEDYASFVNLKGEIHDYGSSVYNYKTSAVRPAMWIENN